MEKVILITGATSDVGVKLIEDLNTQFDKIICHYCCNKNVLEEQYADEDDKVKYFVGKKMPDIIYILLQKFFNLQCYILCKINRNSISNHFITVR